MFNRANYGGYRYLRLQKIKVDEAEFIPFSQILTIELVMSVLQSLKYEFRDIIFSPITTLWVFLFQTLSDDGSCRCAVANFNSNRLILGQTGCSLQTGSYIKARSRLPEKFYSEITRRIGTQLEEQIPNQWLWKGQTVKVVDGTTVSMADSQENQEVYPLLNTQENGIAFPTARLVVVFSLASGVVIDMGAALF